MNSLFKNFTRNRLLLGTPPLSKSPSITAQAGPSVRRRTVHSSPRVGEQAEFAHPRGGTRSSTGRSPFLLVAVSITSGIVGYTIAKYAQPGRASETERRRGFEKPRFGSPEDFKRAIEELRQAFPDPDTVSTDPEDLRIHGFSDYDYRPGRLHSVVFYPKSTEDVVQMVKIATQYKMPVIPYSGATSLEGHTRSHVLGGICVDMSGMDRILEIHEADSDLVCQPGARWMDVNETLREKGIPLFFPIPDQAPPSGECLAQDVREVRTIFIMKPRIWLNTPTANAVRYGTAKAEWFLNATVVLPSGEVIKTRRRSRKSSAGFDTTKLFIGAEGTLGIVTEVTIRLAPLLPTTVAVVQFPNVRQATEAVIEVMNQGVGIQCVELVDDVFMTATNKYGMSARKWPEKDSLFFKFQGPTPGAIKETAKIVKQIVEKHGGSGFELARNAKEADDLWADRKNAHYSAMALLEGASAWATDVCVPVSKLPELVYETKKDLAQIGIVSVIVGHVGDGNFHAQLLFRNEEEYKKAKEATHRMVHRAIALDGTCTGEHGVGLGKKKYLVEELGAGTVGLMKTIKRVIDPYGLFNPGKVSILFQSGWVG
ncbi:hypothetical protein H0H81_000761 [Sphagnurus paluster]|uniref:D-lactate dehydrogenase (cytochrome) n=1 Tax=Sphagnurus paluster TaxID=117069 RepID=A0A9P7FMX6_9AGAR|nr:hypothetical protein H0H81_000761 [Sphagnurus paluster]